MNRPDLTWRQLVDKWLDGSFRAADEHVLHELLEKEDDAFRREATRGLMRLPAEDHQSRIARLRKQAGQSSMRGLRAYRYAAAAAILLLTTAIFGWLLLRPDLPAETDAIAISAETLEPNREPSATDEIAGAFRKLPPDARVGSDPRPAPSGPAPAPGSYAAPLAATGADDSRHLPDTDEGAGLDLSYPSAVEEAPGARYAAKDIRETQDKAAASGQDLIVPEKEVQPNPSGIAQPPSGPQLSKRARRAPPAAAGPEFVSGVRPEEGWTIFYEQLAAASPCISSANGTELRDTVRLRFTIDKDGFSRKVVIVSARHPECASEAERIVMRRRWIVDDSVKDRDFLISLPFGKN
ncbi:MAG: energy transducer TonB [Saprospiraceae bacterium]